MAGEAKKRKRGRPSTYTPKIAETICHRIILGEPVRQICADDDMPAESTVYLWLIQHDDFSEQYARAKEAQAERFAEELLDISDDGRNDWIERENKDGSTYEALNGEAIQRSKLRVETRKWLMGKMRPKKYGDRLDLTSGGEKLPPPRADEDLAVAIAKLLAANAG